MRVDLKDAISSAIIKLLRPLVRVLLKNNIPYGTFAELAKWVYVDVASRDFAIMGRKQTISRISVITGLSRKEVKRIREIKETGDLGAAERYNRAARVISGWIKDPRFLDEKGDPMELPFDSDGVSFSDLVKRYSGDVPPRAILDEMIRSGVVEKRCERVRLLKRGYIVTKDTADKLNILGVDVGELISTIAHNLESSPSEAFLQRKAMYDNIPEEAQERLRELIARLGREFIETIDREISRFDRDVNPDVRGKGRKKVGVGIFYFE